MVSGSVSASGSSMGSGSVSTSGSSRVSGSVSASGSSRVSGSVSASGSSGVSGSVSTSGSSRVSGSGAAAPNTSARTPPVAGVESRISVSAASPVSAANSSSVSETTRGGGSSSTSSAVTYDSSFSEGSFSVSSSRSGEGDTLPNISSRLGVLALPVSSDAGVWAKMLSRPAGTSSPLDSSTSVSLTAGSVFDANSASRSALTGVLEIPMFSRSLDISSDLSSLLVEPSMPMFSRSLSMELSSSSSASANTSSDGISGNTCTPPSLMSE